MKAGLLAWSYGTADSLFFTTARITGLEFFDANGRAVTDFSLASASGTDYIHAVPEPSSALMLLAGLGLLFTRSPRGRRHGARPVS